MSCDETSFIYMPFKVFISLKSKSSSRKHKKYLESLRKSMLLGRLIYFLYLSI